MERELSEFMEYVLIDLVGSELITFWRATYYIAMKKKKPRVRSNKGMLNLDMMKNSDIYLNFRFKKEDIERGFKYVDNCNRHNDEDFSTEMVEHTKKIEKTVPQNENEEVQNSVIYIVNGEYLSEDEELNESISFESNDNIELANNNFDFVVKGILSTKSVFEEASDENSLADPLKITEETAEDNDYREYLDHLQIYNNISGFRKRLTTVQMVTTFAKKMPTETIDFNLYENIKSDKVIDFEKLYVKPLSPDEKENGPYTSDSKLDITKSYNPAHVKEMVLKMLSKIIKENESYLEYETTEKFWCIACQTRFQFLFGFQLHLVRKVAKFVYLCRSCGFTTFYNPCSLVYHLMVDNKNTKMEHYCYACSNFKNSIADHFQDSQCASEFKVFCEPCNFVSLSRCSFDAHQRMHNEEIFPYICPICGDVFLTYKLLKKHMNDVCFFSSIIFRYICSHCEVIFCEKKTLLNHIRDCHINYECSICSNIFVSINLFKEHVNICHSPSSVITKSCFQSCSLCPGVVILPTNIQQHLNYHINDSSIFIKLYVCECSYFTNLKSKFAEHKKIKCTPDPMDFKDWEFPQEMKFCIKCNEICFVDSSFNPVCEKCQILENPTCMFKYNCITCRACLEPSNWKEIIRHYKFFHLSKKYATISVKNVAGEMSNTIYTESQSENKKNIVNLPFFTVQKLTVKDSNFEFPLTGFEQKNNDSNFEMENVDTNENISAALLESYSETIDKVIENVKIPKNLKYTCQQCDYECSSKKALMSHFKVHKKPNSFQCRQCGQCFITQTLRSFHIHRRHRKKNLNNIKVNDVEFNSTAKMVDNIRCVDMVKVCGSFCEIQSTDEIVDMYEDESQNKNFDMSMNEEFQEIFHEEEKIFICPVCQRNFDSVELRNSHLRSHGLAYLKYVQITKDK